MKPRTWTIDADRPLGKVVASLLREPRKAAIQTIRQGRVRIDGQVCRKPGHIVRAGQRLAIEAGDAAPSRPSGHKKKHLDNRPRSNATRGRPPKDTSKKPEKGPLPRVVYQDDD